MNILQQLNRLDEASRDYYERRKVLLLCSFSILYLLSTCLLASRKPMWLDELFTFYISGVSSVSDPGRIRASYRTTLSRSTSTGAILHECAERYAIKTGLDLVNLRPLQLLNWLLHSHSEYRHFVTDVVVKPELETLRRRLLVSLWPQEIPYTSTA
jgi:hypothetical protein